MSDLASGRVAHAAQAAFRVLVVDDDPDMAGFLALLLAQQGMHADIAADGHVALQMIAAAPPDLVLLDVQMPGPSGFDICRRLKSEDSTALLPVVLITALEDHESRRARLGRANVEVLAQHLLDEPHHVQAVVDDERDRPLHAAPDGALTTGSETSMSVPPPARDLASMVPPCMRTIPSHTARPRPEPSNSRRRFTPWPARPAR